MAGGQQGVDQDASLQLVGMAFGVFLYTPCAQFLCVCPSCAGEPGGAFFPMHRWPQTLLGEGNEGSVGAGLALRLLVVHIRGSVAVHEPYLTRLIFAL